MNTKNNFVLRDVLVFVCLIGMVELSLPCASVEATLYQQNNLVSDITGLADNLDSNLVNPWGIASSPTGPFWISDNGTGVSTVYNGAGQPFPVGSPLVVTIPPPGGTPPSAPTGLVFNGTTDFLVDPVNRAFFIFAAEDGTISGWNPVVNPTGAILQVNNSGFGAVYKGIALGNNGSSNLLYAANFSAGTIDIFDSSFSPTTLSGSFTDPNLPAGYAPFNIQNIGGSLYVTYALQDASKQDDVPGSGNGYVDVYDTNGNLIRRLISEGELNSPWGIALAPAMFGEFSNDLLIGNFGDGSINAFDPTSGMFLGQMLNEAGNPLVIQGIWGLMFGNGGNGGDLDTLYFTAGIPGSGSVEDHGLFGSIQPIPEPSTFLLLGAGLAGVGLLRRRFKK